MQVGRSDHVDGAAEGFRRERRAHEGGVTAVRTAVDADPLPIDAAEPNEMVDRVEQVGVHGPAPLLVAGVAEGLAVPGRATEVDLYAGVATVGQPLGFGVVAPGVAAPRPAMDVDDGR